MSADPIKIFPDPQTLKVNWNTEHPRKSYQMQVPPLVHISLVTCYLDEIVFIGSFKLLLLWLYSGIFSYLLNVCQVFFIGQQFQKKG